MTAGGAGPGRSGDRRLAVFTIAMVGLAMATVAGCCFVLLYLYYRIFPDGPFS